MQLDHHLVLAQTHSSPLIGVLKNIKQSLLDNTVHPFLFTGDTQPNLVAQPCSIFESAQEILIDFGLLDSLCNDPAYLLWEHQCLSQQRQDFLSNLRAFIILHHCLAVKIPQLPLPIMEWLAKKVAPPSLPTKALNTLEISDSQWLNGIPLPITALALDWSYQQTQNSNRFINQRQKIAQYILEKTPNQIKTTE